MERCKKMSIWAISKIEKIAVRFAWNAYKNHRGKRNTISSPDRLHWIENISVFILQAKKVLYQTLRIKTK